MEIFIKIPLWSLASILSGCLISKKPRNFLKILKRTATYVQKMAAIVSSLLKRNNYE